MSFRYWRISGVLPVGYGGLSLSEVGLYVSEVRVDTPAMLSSAQVPTSGALADLSDGSASVACYWSVQSIALPSWALVYDLGTPQAVDEVRLGSGLLASEFPSNISIQYSSDGLIWDGQMPLRGLDWPGPNAILPLVFPQAPISVFLPFDQDLGGYVKNFGFAGGTATLVGGATISPSNFKFGGGGLELNGTTGYARLYPFTATEQFNATGDFSIGCQVKYNSAGSIRCIWDFQEALQLRLYIQDERLRLNNTQYTIAIDSAPGAHGLNNSTHKHVLVQRVAGVIRIFVDGVQVGNDYANTSDLSATGPFYVGVTSSSDWYFLGNIDEVEISVGATLYPHTTFTPPAAMRPRPTGYSNTQYVRVRPSQPVQPSGIELPPIICYSAERSNRLRLDFIGWGSISGTVKELGVPDNEPLRRHVFCIEQTTFTCVADTWSDSVTGAYEFLDLDHRRKYSVVAEDYEGVYRSVIANNLTPELP